MNTKLKTALYVGETYLGYGLSEYIPTNIVFKKWNKAAAGIVLVGSGLMLKESQYASHVLSFGIGVLFNGVLDGFGMGY